MFKPNRSGNLIADDFITDRAMTGFESINVKKCPNIDLDTPIIRNGSIDDVIFDNGTIDDIIYEGKSYRNIFENDTDGITLPNGVKTFEISGNDLVQRVMKYTLQSSDITTLNTTLSNNDLVRVNPSSLTGYIGGITSKIDYNMIFLGTEIIGNIDNLNLLENRGNFAINISDIFYIVAKGTYASLTEAQADLAGTNIWYQLATPIVLHTFTTAPSQAQLDEWLDMYLTLKGSTTNTGTEFYQDRYYVDYDNAKVYDYNIIEPYLPTTLDTPIYENLSLRDIFESVEISATGKNLFDNDIITERYSSSYSYITPLIYGGTGNSITVQININFDSTVGNRFLYVVDSVGNPIGSQLTFTTLGLKTATRTLTTDSFRIILLNTVINDATEYDAFKDIFMIELGSTATTYESYLDLAMILETPSLYGTVDLVRWDTGSLFTTAPSQVQLDGWLSTYLYLSNKTEVMEDILDKTVTLTAIPVKYAWPRDVTLCLGELIYSDPNAAFIDAGTLTGGPTDETIDGGEFTDFITEYIDAGEF